MLRCAFYLRHSVEFELRKEIHRLQEYRREGIQSFCGKMNFSSATTRRLLPVLSSPQSVNLIQGLWGCSDDLWHWCMTWTHFCPLRSFISLSAALGFVAAIVSQHRIHARINLSSILSVAFRQLWNVHPCLAFAFSSSSVFSWAKVCEHGTNSQCDFISHLFHSNLNCQN